MRLFRQPTIGDWTSVFSRIAEACAPLARYEAAADRGAAANMTEAIAIDA